MDRNEYLGRCKVYAMAKAAGNQHDLERVKVAWRGRAGSAECFPESYKLSYDEKGAIRHTACLIDCNSRCAYNVLLDEVEAAHGGKM